MVVATLIVFSSRVSSLKDMYFFNSKAGDWKEDMEKNGGERSAKCWFTPQLLQQTALSQAEGGSQELHVSLSYMGGRNPSPWAFICYLLAIMNGQGRQVLQSSRTE